MTTSAKVVATLKAQLKQRGMTYRELAQRLDLSESAIKHMFSTGNLSLKRLDDICGVLELGLGDLVNIAQASDPRIETLSPELEAQLVADIRLLLVAYCLVNYWTVDEILARYRISPSQGMRLLTKLDRMKLIELQPGNRVRLLIANNFQWQKNGAIEQYFRRHVQAEFFDSDFTEDGALRIAKNAMLSIKSQRVLNQRLQAIGEQFDEASRDERRLPARERDGVTMVLAIRNWGFAGFRQLERDAPTER
ncbi:MAG: helix-turn-helix domain-containing protein [Gammaproteobacteria bacterium]